MKPTEPKSAATLSLDLDDRWAYLKARGTEGWEFCASYFDYFIPRYIEVCEKAGVTSTVFVVGRDAAKSEHQSLLKSLVQAGNEMGNHSWSHEPWMQQGSPAEVEHEIAAAEDAILAATGERTVGWRGPGFCCSPEILSTLKRRGYQYDGSTFPTFLGPIARLYYLATAKPDAEQHKQLETLYGSLSDGLRSLKPYHWETAHGPLLELPVTTFPFFRAPVHGSYLGFLATYSMSIAKLYFTMAMMACRVAGIAPSFLLHPLDFMGSDEIDGLEFFPGMKVPGAKKRELMAWALQHLAKHHEVLPMGAFAAKLVTREQYAVQSTLPLKSFAKA
jgi:peptidoglycan-N-acetylglucosamine deacetylase